MVSNTFLLGPVCWKNKELSYGRGAGTLPQSRCPSHRPVRHASLCYKRCRSGYKSFGCCICYKGWKTYGRGVGIALERYCPSGLEMDGGLCYRPCRDDYKGVSSIQLSDLVDAFLWIDQVFISNNHFRLSLFSQVGPVCWLRDASYGRGVAVPARECETTHPEKNEKDGFCYKMCRFPYISVRAFLCHEQ